jgi:hypothetical protein
MEVKRKNGAPGIRHGSGLRFGIFALMFSLAILPAVAKGQISVQAGSDTAVGPAKAVQDEIRHAALRQLREGNLEQVLKILEVPAEWALPISLVEDDSLRLDRHCQRKWRAAGGNDSEPHGCGACVLPRASQSQPPKP